MFKTFPAFSKLTLADREEYEALIKDYPPVADISFGTLMSWWDNLDGLAISRLNNNLVISYWIPGYEKHSGLALIGTENVDESICMIFDYQQEQGEKSRLVNVPEFVVNNLRFPELFAFKSGRGDDEYLLSPSRFAAVDSMPLYMRTRVRRFIRENGADKIEIKPLDLGDHSSQALLLQAKEDWPLKGLNNINKLERDVLPRNIKNGASLGLKAIGLFVDSELQGYCLYYFSSDNSYVVMAHARVNYDTPRAFEYMAHAFSKYLSDRGVKYINIDADLDSLSARALKIALKPENFFRKYTIEPRR